MLRRPFLSGAARDEHHDDQQNGHESNPPHASSNETPDKICLFSQSDYA